MASGTEYACRAKKGFLRYATRFQKPSVLKTGFWGTEGIFGTGNALLRYATRFLKPSVLKTGFWGTEGIFGTGNALLGYATRFQRRETAFCCTGHIFKDAELPPATPNASSDVLQF